jgi:hypothetical protein
MNLKELSTYLDSIKPPLKEYQKSTLSSMFYNAYQQGIEEGKNQVKNGIFKLIEKMIEDN